MKKLFILLISISIGILSYAQVILPSSETIWTKGKSAEIRWTQSNYSNDIVITLERGEVTVKTIISRTVNNGSFTWKAVPTDLTTVGAYYVKVAEIDGQPMNRSEAFTIQDPAPSKPTVTTGSPKSISTTSAYLNGKINPNGAKTNYYFKYSTDSKTWINYGGSSISAGYNEVSIGPVYFGVLKPGTKYYYKLVAANSSEPVEGLVNNFTTLSEVTQTTPIKSATVKWYKNNVAQTTTYYPGAQENINPDAGTKVEVTITKATNVTSPATFYVSDFNNQSYSKNRSSSLTSETFTNCAGPLDTELLLTVNTNEGGIRVRVFWSKPPSPDLTVSNVSVDGATTPTGINFLVGQTVKIQNVVWNMGKANALVASKLALFLKSVKDDVAGTPLKTNDIPALNSGLGSTQQFSYTFTGSDIGDKYFVLKADNTNLVNEGTLEGNNIFSFGPFKVSSPANLSLSKTSLSFGNTNINGCSTEQECILKNNGTTTITGTAFIVNTTHFNFTSGGSSFSLAAGASKSIKVKFCPVSIGSQSSNLEIVVDGTTVAIAQATLTGTGVSVPETLIGYSNEFLFDTKKELAKTGGIYLKIIETKGTKLIAKAGYEFNYLTEANTNQITGSTIFYNKRVEKFEVSKDGEVFIGEPVLAENQDWDGSIKRLLFFDNQENLIGHIIFEYSFIHEKLQARQAIIFLHNDQAICNPTDNTEKFFPYSINNPNNPTIKGEKVRYNYYNDGEYPVSMLIPPTVFDKNNISRGFVIPDLFNKVPVLFVHGVSGTYSYDKDVADVSKTENSGDQVSYWFDTAKKLNQIENASKYDAWEFYYPPEDDNSQIALMLRNVVDVLYDSFYKTMPINLVTHSMGGLIAMQYFTNSSFDEKNKVGKVLLIDPPIHGSLTANNFYLSNNLLQNLGGWKTGKDRFAPAYRDLSIGSDFLYNLNIRTWDNTIIDKTFVIIGLTRNNYVLPNFFHIEAGNHSDGVVSFSSASLLDKGIGFAGFYGNHDDGKFSNINVEDKDFLSDLIDNYLTLNKSDFQKSCTDDTTIEILVDGNKNVIKPAGNQLNAITSNRSDVDYQKSLLTLTLSSRNSNSYFLRFHNWTNTYRILEQNFTNFLQDNSYDYVSLGSFDRNIYARDLSLKSKYTYYFNKRNTSIGQYPSDAGFDYPKAHLSGKLFVFYFDGSNFPEYIGNLDRKNMEHQYLPELTQTKAATLANQETPVKKINQKLNSEFSENQIFIDNQTSSAEFILYGETAFNSRLKYGISLIKPDGTKIDSATTNIVYTNDPFTSVKKITIQNPLPGKWNVIPVIDPSFQVNDFITKAKLASDIVAKSAIEVKNPSSLIATVNVPDPSKMKTDSLSAYAIVKGETVLPDTIYLTTKQSSGNLFTVSKLYNQAYPGNYNYTLIVTGNYNNYRFERAVYGSFTVENNITTISVPNIDLTQTNLFTTLKMSNYFMCNQCDPTAVTYEVGLTNSSFIDEDLELNYSPENSTLTVGVSSLSIRAYATLFVNVISGTSLLATDTFKVSYTTPGIPVDLTATSVSRNSANLSWIPKGEETKWEIIYGFAGFNPYVEGSLITNVNESGYKLQGLQQGAAYDFYARAVFSDTEKSGWSWPGSFATNHVINVTALSNGSANPVGETEVSHNGNFTVRFLPNEGYHVSDVLIDGKSVGAVENYTFSNISGNHAVIVAFQMNVYNITATVYPPLAGSVIGTGQFMHGANINLSAQPAAGYKFVNWTENFAAIGSNPSYSFAAQSNRTLQANFSLPTGLTKIEKGEMIIYPNPSNNTVTVQLKDGQGIGQIQVFNVLGQKLINTNQDKVSIFEFDVKDWSPGVYLIQLSTDRGLMNAKFRVIK
jgi:pimeloyl-ACP methyl ester carboxylesterase